MLIDTRTKSRAYGRHSAFAPFFASTWPHSLPYAEVSINNFELTTVRARLEKLKIIREKSKYAELVDPMWSEYLDDNRSRE